MIKAIVFDLDDTLMDTTGQLTRKGQIAAIRAMIKAGLPLKQKDVARYRDSFVRKRGEHILTTPAIAKSLVKDRAEARRLTKIGLMAYYSIPIKNIRPLPGAINLLGKLKKRGCRLYIISHGLRKTQMKKINELKIKRYFDRIFIDNDMHTGFKERYFGYIVKHEIGRNGVKPQDIMSVGDKIDSEIMLSNKLGLTTVQIIHGRYSKLKPKNRFQKADYKIKRVKDLMRILNKN